MPFEMTADVASPDALRGWRGMLETHLPAQMTHWLPPDNRGPCADRCGEIGLRMSIPRAIVRRVIRGGTDRCPVDEKEHAMAKYVFVFRNDPNRAATAGEEEAWTKWFGELGGAVTDFGNRVSRARMVGASVAGTDADALSGYVVVTADSLDSAVALAEG